MDGQLWWRRVAIFLLLTRQVTCRTCEPGTIEHSRGGDTLCCFPEYCPKDDTHVVTCVSNYTQDTCEPCPEETSLMYGSSSYKLKQCYSLPSCIAPKESRDPVRVAIDSKTCECDREHFQYEKSELPSHPNNFSCQLRNKLCEIGKEPLRGPGCQECRHGSYKNISGNNTHCQDWSVCHMLGRVQVQAGSSSHDVVCADRGIVTTPPTTIPKSGTPGGSTTPSSATTITTTTTDSPSTGNYVLLPVLGCLAVLLLLVVGIVIFLLRKRCAFSRLPLGSRQFINNAPVSNGNSQSLNGHAAIPRSSPEMDSDQTNRLLSTDTMETNVDTMSTDPRGSSLNGEPHSYVTMNTEYIDGVHPPNSTTLGQTAKQPDNFPAESMTPIQGILPSSVVTPPSQDTMPSSVVTPPSQDTMLSSIVTPPSQGTLPNCAVTTPSHGTLPNFNELMSNEPDIVSIESHQPLLSDTEPKLDYISDASVPCEAFASEQTEAKQHIDSKDPQKSRTGDSRDGETCIKVLHQDESLAGDVKTSKDEPTQASAYKDLDVVFHGSRDGTVPDSTSVEHPTADHNQQTIRKCIGAGAGDAGQGAVHASPLPPLWIPKGVATRYNSQSSPPVGCAGSPTPSPELSGTGQIFTHRQMSNTSNTSNTSHNQLKPITGKNSNKPCIAVSPMVHEPTAPSGRQPEEHSINQSGWTPQHQDLNASALSGQLSTSPVNFNPPHLGTDSSVSSGNQNSDV